MMTFSDTAKARLTGYLDTVFKPNHTPPKRCIINLINKSVSGGNHSIPPPCMSCAIAEWFLVFQHSLPSDIVRSEEFRDLVIECCSTGILNEKVRTQIIVEWAEHCVKEASQFHNHDLIKKYLTVCREVGNLKTKVLYSCLIVSHLTMGYNRSIEWDVVDPCGLLRKLIDAGV